MDKGRALLVAAVLVAAAVAPAARVRAGPPFVTDDPEPVDHRHFEVYLASQLAHEPSGWSGTTPHLEVNYGPLPDVQISAAVPLAFDAPEHGPTHFGPGDVEVALKWRFLQESDSRPQVAFFPRVSLPSGDESRGLGAGRVRAILPIWLQKSWGEERREWTAFGGGGYWLNPSSGNRDWWYVGAVLERRVTDSLTLGAEAFHATASEVGGRGSTWLNGGAIYDLSDTYHLLVSAGHNVAGPSGFQAYVAVEFTFGLE